MAARNEAIEANRIVMMEQLKIQSWLQGQAIFKAYIEYLQDKQASPEEIEKLQEMAATQGFGAGGKIGEYSMNIIAILLFIVLIGSMWLFPTATPALGITLLLFILAIATSSIFKKHEQAENPRPKIAKDILILVITLLLILFLGGLVGMYANYYASPRFGVIAGFVSAIAASFAVGYLVKKGLEMVVRFASARVV